MNVRRIVVWSHVTIIIIIIIIIIVVVIIIRYYIFHGKSARLASLARRYYYNTVRAHAARPRVPTQSEIPSQRVLSIVQRCTATIYISAGHARGVLSRHRYLVKRILSRAYYGQSLIFDREPEADWLGRRLDDHRPGRLDKIGPVG